jgi:hypothetical protein
VTISRLRICGIKFLSLVLLSDNRRRRRLYANIPDWFKQLGMSQAVTPLEQHNNRRPCRGPSHDSSRLQVLGG